MAGEAPNSGWPGTGIGRAHSDIGGDSGGFEQLEECGITASHFAARDVVRFNIMMTFLSSQVAATIDEVSTGVASLDRGERVGGAAAAEAGAGGGGGGGAGGGGGGG